MDTGRHDQRLHILPGFLNTPPVPQRKKSKRGRSRQGLLPGAFQELIANLEYVTRPGVAGDQMLQNIEQTLARTSDIDLLRQAREVAISPPEEARIAAGMRPTSDPGTASRLTNTWREARSHSAPLTGGGGPRSDTVMHGQRASSSKKTWRTSIPRSIARQVSG